MALQAVLFDTENVLYDGTALWRWLVVVLRQLGRDVTYDTLYPHWRDEYRRRVSSGACAFFEAFRSFLADYGLSASEIGEIEAAARSRRHRLADPQRVFPGVPHTLAQLKARDLRLGALCNSDRPAECLEAALAGMGLEGVFDSIVSSRDLGVCQPDRAAYKASLGELGAAPERTAFVGHVADELDGAGRLGMITVAFNHEPGARADFYAARFCDIVHLVSEADTHRAAQPEPQLVGSP